MTLLNTTTNTTADKITAASSVNILYVLALSHEAKPLYEKLQARLLISKHGFKLYHVEGKNKTNGSAVLVTGSGCNAMSAGLAWSQQYLPRVKAFLNVGIVGHGSLSIGSVFLVSKVCDDNSGKCSYPHPIVKKHQEIQFSNLVTVAKPSASYQPNCGYDMEASAFFETGRRFLNAEAVQSIKVVSDTPESDFTQLTPKVVNELIAKNSDSILTYAKELLLSAVPNDMSFDQGLMVEIQEKWNVSMSNQTILNELLTSAALLASHSKKPFPQPKESETLKQYLAIARQWVLSAKPLLYVSKEDEGHG